MSRIWLFQVEKVYGKQKMLPNWDWFSW
jgi:hypothetical protein